MTRFAKNLTKQLSSRISGMVINDVSEMHDMAEEILQTAAIKSFLDKHPSGHGIVLLDRTVEGAVGHSWITIKLSNSSLLDIKKYWTEVAKQMEIQRDLGLGYCFACQRKFMMLPDIPDEKALQTAKQLIKDHGLIPTKKLCPNCCGNLKTDSDYDGLTYIP